MRTSDALIAAALAGLVVAVSPSASAFDGTQTPSNQMPPPLTAAQAFRNGARALRLGETAKAVTALQYAAENGHPVAQWKLGQMYASGDGVKRNDLRAFDYFSRIADMHADDRPDSPRARFVSNAFVALGKYYLKGIPNSPVHANPVRAREMFHYAATYFADPDAQYDLARLYLSGKGGPRDPRQAVRWLSLAAHKGQYQAQALLGAMLFKGKVVRRQASRGLMWLTLACDSAVRPDDKWIKDLCASAFKQATDDEQAVALIYLERWMKHRHE